ncbi:acetylornithine deacetylase [Spartinivicinus marinus]|nr:acetylornithine deacetylase [Spartinivicinus marinus]
MSKLQLATMLTNLIEIPSISCTNPKLDQSNRPVIDLLANWLSELGFKIEIIPLPNQPQKANLIATLGSGPGGLVLAGHTDTVPYDQQRWQYDPFKLTEAGNKWYGLGVCDMKGFFALAIEAIKPFLDKPLKQPLIILATADEESSMDGARALAKAGKPKARYAVIGEPTGLKPIYMHKGIMMERVHIKGQAGHSSNPALGINAIEVMHQVIDTILSFRTELATRYNNPLFEVPAPTLNLGCIHGGDNPNRICGECSLEYDLRPLPGLYCDELREMLQARISPISHDYQIPISVEAIFPGVEAFATDKNSTLIKTVETLTGHHAESVAFATEAPFLQELGMETVVLGPGNIDQAHQPDEYLSMDTVKPTVSLLQQLISEFCC